MLLKRQLIYIDNKDKTDRIARYYEQCDKLVVVFKGSSKEFAYIKKQSAEKLLKHFRSFYIYVESLIFFEIEYIYLKITLK